SYMQWGSSVLKRFNGMFAIAIWDSREKELFLARDRFGKKPLYYTFLNGEVTFASELTAIMADEGISKTATPSIPALNHYLAMGYILSPLTIYKDIHKLEPATFARIKNGKLIEKTRYWEYKDYFYEKSRQSESEIIENLDHLISRAVKSRLISDVPVGAFLSGGLDSSGVTAYTKKHINSDLHTFSVGFASDSYNESDDARIVSEHVKTIHHAMLLKDDLSVTAIKKCISAFDEPFSDTSLIPMVEVASLASKYITVVLSGDGADEIFAGYETYKADAIKKRLDIIPAFIRRVCAFILNKFSIETNRKVGLGFKIRQFSKGMSRDFQYAHYCWRELHGESERIELLGKENIDEIRASDPFLIFKRYYDETEGLDPLSRNLYVDAKTWLADDILVKVDRATMASSIESRAPFLDSDLVEYAASIPSRFKLNGSCGKYILKRVLEKHLPKSTIYKKKAGFNAPVNVWLKNSGENEFRFFNKFVIKNRPEFGVLKSGI
ncbi:MAG TPA: asparagine synthase (glutamine-hydrolyzing), partial [Candidatus Wallbacteria bacterium]|nr:asparagine synthase (glutamine-hydrolyzing) [Candidatus Wallbacteria bacterium]